MKTKQHINKVFLFSQAENSKSLKWVKRISSWLKTNFPSVEITDKNYQAIIVLGGDGSLLKAARECKNYSTIMVGLNLGNIGFLSSARDPKDFFPSLKKLLKGDFSIVERGKVEASIERNKKIIFSITALNEIAVLNPLGMAKIIVKIDNYTIQKIYGTGVILSTATGSTAYNLSAHGPVIMPNSRNFVLTELLDHGIPTPSIVLNENQKVAFIIKDFHKRELLYNPKIKEKIDMTLIADGEVMRSLFKGDKIIIKRFPYTVKTAEFEKNYFLKSLQKKFSFK